MLPETHEHTDRCWWHPEQARWVCADPPLTDVRDMIVVHTALRREFRLAPAAVARAEPAAVGRVDRHLGFLCDLLHHHHAGEDALLWPKLRERVPAPAVRFLDEVEGQHAALDAALAAVTAARADWIRDPATRDRLVAALHHLHDLLDEHLDTEERAVLPLAAAHLTPAEWNAVGEAAVAALPKPTLLLAFGMFAYEGDPAVLRAMLAPAPPPVRLLLPRVAPRTYARHARRIHATARP